MSRSRLYHSDDEATLRKVQPFDAFNTGEFAASDEATSLDLEVDFDAADGNPRNRASLDLDVSFDEPGARSVDLDLDLPFDPMTAPEDMSLNLDFDDEGEPKRESTILRPSGGKPDEAPELAHARVLLEEAAEREASAQEALAKMENGVEAILAEAHERAERIVEEARAEARQIAEQARTQADRIEAQAYQAGFEQGEEAGKRLSEQKVESVLRRLQSFATAITEQKEQLLRESESDMVQIAFLIALQIVHREIQRDESVVLDVVRSAIEHLQRASRLTIFVSPHDFRFVQDHISQLDSLDENETEFRIESDETIARGGCRIQSDAGEVDATIDAMVQKLRGKIQGEE